MALVHLLILVHLLNLLLPLDSDLLHFPFVVQRYFLLPWFLLYQDFQQLVDYILTQTKSDLHDGSRVFSYRNLILVLKLITTVEHGLASMQEGTHWWSCLLPTELVSRSYWWWVAHRVQYCLSGIRSLKLCYCLCTCYTMVYTTDWISCTIGTEFVGQLLWW